MGRVVRNKELKNTRLATNYGGWMYCTECNKNIGYLCYATYDELRLDYECNCGNKGSVVIDFEDSQIGCHCEKELITIKNRYCCPDDASPLITMLDKNVKQYEFEITCKSCGKHYNQKSKNEGGNF